MLLNRDIGHMLLVICYTFAGFVSTVFPQMKCVSYFVTVSVTNIAVSFGIGTSGIFSSAILLV